MTYRSWFILELFGPGKQKVDALRLFLHRRSSGMLDDGFPVTWPGSVAMVFMGLINNIFFLIVSSSGP
jgi:hypothetical protein